MLHFVAGILFFLLSPGVLLTIPAGGRGLFASGQTSVVAAAVHATLFVAALYALHTFMNVEGFAACSQAVKDRCKRENPANSASERACRTRSNCA